MEIIKIALILFISIYHSKGCGISTHTEIIQRALANYDNPAFGDGQILRILSEHQGAFQAGAPFPDTFYNRYCRGLPPLTNFS